MVCSRVCLIIECKFPVYFSFSFGYTQTLSFCMYLLIHAFTAETSVSCLEKRETLLLDVVCFYANDFFVFRILFFYDSVSNNRRLIKLTSIIFGNFLLEHFLFDRILNVQTVHLQTHAVLFFFSLAVVSYRLNVT